MLEVLLFSFSISIDAFGYSMGFGTKNIKISKIEFLIFNLINSTILTIFLMAFSHISFLLNNGFVEKISPLILCLFGLYYVVQSFYVVIKSIISKKKNIEINVVKKEYFKHCSENYFKFSDLVLLFSVFIFENAFSAFVFYTHLSMPILFVLTNFIFHYMFFIIGFDLGNKIVKRVNLNTSFISGFIFLILGFYNLFY